MFTWKYAGIFCSIVGSVVVTFYVLWRMVGFTKNFRLSNFPLKFPQKRAEQERNRKHAIGRVRIGGEWELINVYYDTGSAVMDKLHELGLGLMEFPSFTGNYEAMVEYHSDVEHGFGAHLAPQQPNGG